MVVLSFCTGNVGAWLSLVERLLGVQEVAGSNPVAPTILDFRGISRRSRRRYPNLVPESRCICEAVACPASCSSNVWTGRGAGLPTYGRIPARPPGRPPASASRSHASCSYPHPPRKQGCHGGCFPRAPHLSRAVLRPRCARARPAPCAPWSAMSNALDTATRFPSSRLRRSPDPRCRRPPPGYVTELAEPSSVPSPPARHPRDRGSQWDAPCPLPKAMNRASRAVTVHAHPPAVSCSLRTSSVMTTLIPESGTEHATASGAEWLRHFNASLLLYPAAVPGGPDKDHASKAVMVFASCPALTRLPCGTRTASTLAAGLCAGPS